MMIDYFEILKIFIQFILLAIIGGAITRYYSKMQKKREQRTSLLKEFSTIHGKFISLRYRFNSSHVFYQHDKNQCTHPLNEEEIRLERWIMYKEACALLGEYQGIKPLLFVNFPTEFDTFNEIHQIYQQWRRKIIRNKPILQDRSGANQQEFNVLKESYLKTATNMKNIVNY